MKHYRQCRNEPIEPELDTDPLADVTDTSTVIRINSIVMAIDATSMGISRVDSSTDDYWLMRADETTIKISVDLISTKILARDTLTYAVCCSFVASPLKNHKGR